MNRTERLYAIVEELRLAGPAGRTSRWLAARFEVSVRTVKRDLAALAEAEVPVWSVDGRSGGYRLQRSALPPLTFTTGEATAIALALAAEPDLPFGSDGRAVLTKVLSAMSAEQRRTTARLASRVWFRVPARRADARILRALEEAVRDRRVVNVDYRDRSGRRSRSRPVEAQGLARTDGAWWLLGWCRRRDAPRWFRLDRIEAAHVTGERFEPRALESAFGAPPPDAHPVEIEVPTDDRHRSAPGSSPGRSSS